MTTIRELRRQRAWTQFDLAVAVGVQPQTVYLWESGRRQPQVAQMRRLGEVFGLCSDRITLVAERPDPGPRGASSRGGRRDAPAAPTPGRKGAPAAETGAP
jgi:DNA-binding XRE family transcriptional regulator